MELEAISAVLVVFSLKLITCYLMSGMGLVFSPIMDLDEVVACAMIQAYSHESQVCTTLLNYLIESQYFEIPLSLHEISSVVLPTI